MTAAAARPGDFDLAELSRSSALTGNPVPGLARALTRLVPDPAAKAAVHKGATSQDIMDTAAMLLARDAIDAAADSLSGAAAAAARLADAHRGSLMIGRTLLQQAVPVTFGVVAAGWLAGLDGALDGLASARETRLAVQFGGAAGTLASLGSSGAAVKSLMAAELGLADPPLPWHTERLRVIDVAVAMARVTAALSKIARDVTLLAQTEIAEVSEGAPAAGRREFGAAPGRLLGHAQQEQPGRRGRHPRLRAAGRRPARDPRRQRRAGAPARGRRLARRVAAVQPPARAGRLRRRLGARPAGEPDRRHRRMAGNLAAAGGLPMAERVTALLRDSLGAPQAHDLVATAAARAASSGVPLRDVLLATPDVADKLSQAGISAAEIEQALNPAGYLGAPTPSSPPPWPPIMPDNSKKRRAERGSQ